MSNKFYEINGHLNDLWNLQSNNKNKGIKLLTKIFNNILKNPNESKYSDLNHQKIRNKFDNCLPAYHLLFTAGFKDTAPYHIDSRLQLPNTETAIQILSNVNNQLLKRVQNDHHQHIESQFELKPVEMTKILIHGFLRDSLILKQKSMNNGVWMIPSDIVDIILSIIQMIVVIDFNTSNIKFEQEYFEIINNNTIRCIKDAIGDNNDGRWYGKCIISKYKLPTKSNNPSNFKSIIMNFEMNVVCGIHRAHFIGLIPNTTNNINISPWNGLKKAYGVSTMEGVRYTGKDMIEQPYIWGDGMGGDTENSFVHGNQGKFCMEYIVKDGLLRFCNKYNNYLYSQNLPQDGNINNWFLCISLVFAGELITLNSVIIE